MLKSTKVQDWKIGREMKRLSIIHAATKKMDLLDNTRLMAWAITILERRVPSDKVDDAPNVVLSVLRPKSNGGSKDGKGAATDQKSDSAPNVHIHMPPPPPPAPATLQQASPWGMPLPSPWGMQQMPPHSMNAWGMPPSPWAMFSSPMQQGPAAGMPCMPPGMPMPPHGMNTWGMPPPSPWAMFPSPMQHGPWAAKSGPSGSMPEPKADPVDVALDTLSKNTKLFIDNETGDSKQGRKRHKTRALNNELLVKSAVVQGVQAVINIAKQVSPSRLAAALMWMQCCDALMAYCTIVLAAIQEGCCLPPRVQVREPSSHLWGR
eukprot:530757-Rhodomonas_salina.1